MDNLKIVYKILVGIEASMDSNCFDSTFLEVLKISEERRNKILQSMIDERTKAELEKREQALKAREDEIAKKELLNCNVL